MVKTVNATMDDDEHKLAKEAKGEMTWSEFIVMAAKEREGE